MHLISSILFAFSANIDAFIVGMSCGIKKDHISIIGNIVISLITLTGTVFSITAGLTVLPLLPHWAEQVCGSSILILLGLYYIIKYFVFLIKSRKTSTAPQIPPKSDSSAESNEKEKSRNLSCKDTVMLGIALSVNNMGMGIGASITGMSLLPTSLFTFLFSVLLLFAGNHVGESRIFQAVKQYSDPLSGFILIALGIYELFI